MQKYKSRKMSTAGENYFSFYILYVSLRMLYIFHGHNTKYNKLYGRPPPYAPAPASGPLTF